MSNELWTKEDCFAERPIGSIDCADSVGTASVYECQKCFALVHYSTRTQHATWHERLRIAVDEVGQLE